MTKREQNIKYKKAPQAPRRFKSAYMFFSTEKHRQIRNDLSEKLQTTEVAKMVSQAWKNLTAEEREEWDEMARRDKARYEVEKTMYTGPWKVPAKKRTQKDPAAPKRPMSAFLSFSNSKRAMVKAQNPDIGNAEVSRILAKMWKEAPDEERKQHIEREFGLRQEYKFAIAEWRKTADQELDDIRMKREQMAMRTVDAGGQGQDPSGMPPPGPNGVGAPMGSNGPYGGVPTNSGGSMDQYQYPHHGHNYGHPNGQYHSQHASYPQHQHYPQQQQHQYQYEHHRRQDEEDGSEMDKNYGDPNAPHTTLVSAVSASTMGRGPPPGYPPQPPPYGYAGSSVHNAPPHASSSPYRQPYGAYPGAYDETPDGNPQYSMVPPPGAYPPPPPQDGYNMQAPYSQGYGHPPPPEAYDSSYDSASYYNTYYHHPQESMAPPTRTTASGPGGYYGSAPTRSAVGPPTGAPEGGPPLSYPYGTY